MKVVIIGEAMLEYRTHSTSSLGYGGDTLNTAIHLARLGAEVHYVSALGIDPLSDALRRAWQLEGINTQFVMRHPKRQPGIYAIHNTPEGERSFLYWREKSAARDMFSLPEMAEALQLMQGADLVFYSLITLAVLPVADREKLFAATRDAQARGGKFAFDGNFRPVLWPNRDDAIAASCAAAAMADFGLPTWSDETLLHANKHSSTEIAQQWMSRGTKEVAVKTGQDGCVLGCGGNTEMVSIGDSVKVLDTSGAGDAFNGGYLSARMRGQSANDSALAGHRVAAWVIQYAGAIPAINAAAPYTKIS